MAQRTCTIDGCEKCHHARGLCPMHYTRWKTYGVTDLPSWQERFWAKVDKAGGPDSCWLWTGATSHGYGDVRIDSHGQRAHRMAYELLVGPIPEGLHIDHLCRVRSCVNPAHLEPVTQAENIRRGESGKYTRTPRTQCRRGHAMTVENTYVSPGGQRQCRACVALRAGTRWHA